MNVPRHRSGVRHLWSVVALIATLACCSGADACSGDDIWASGYRLPVWQKIDAIQRYPFFGSDPPPDLAAACKDGHPLVRAAACMAIGRVASAEHLPELVPLLDDPVPLVRHYALVALTYIESPRIKQPLLEVLGSWKEVSPPLSGPEMTRLGLPDRMTDLNEVLWTHRLEVRANAPRGGLRSSVGRAVQAGPFLLISDWPPASGPKCLRLSDGKPQYRLDRPFPSLDLAADGRRAVFVGPRGQVMAVRPRDGKTVWRTQIEKAGSYIEVEANVARLAGSPAAYVSVKERIWALDLDSGRVLWQWKWSPASHEGYRPPEYGPYSRLIPLESGVAWLIDWYADPGKRWTDVVHLSDAGEVLLHRTSLLSESRTHECEFYKNGQLFVQYDMDWETWDLSGEQRTDE